MKKQSNPKPEMTNCPTCQVPVRLDNLHDHLAHVHKIQQSPQNMPVRSIQRVCPRCNKNVPVGQWRLHFETCKLQNQLEEKPDQGSQPPLGNQQKNHPIYVTDEFGLVHTYNEWFENEMMGDHIDGLPTLSSDLKSPSVRKVRSKDKKPSVAKIGSSSQLKELVTCSECGARVQPNSLEQHIATSHSESPKIKQKTNSPSKLPERTDSVAMPWDKIDPETQQKIHQKFTKDGGDLAKQLARMKTSIGLSGTQTCPFCSKELPFIDLPDHILKNHPDETSPQ